MTKGNHIQFDGFLNVTRKSKFESHLFESFLESHLKNRGISKIEIVKN